MPSARIGTINADAEASLQAKFDEIDAAGLPPEMALVAKFEAQEKMDAAVLAGSVNVQKDEGDQLVRMANNIHV
jgi:hypothetical protein